MRNIFYKIFLNLDLWFKRRCSLIFFNISGGPYIQEWNHLCKIGRGHNKKHFLFFFFYFGPVVQEMLF